MTRKHFSAIAAVLAETRPVIIPDHVPSADRYFQWSKIRNRMADTCGTFNPKFDRSKFNRATET